MNDKYDNNHFIIATRAHFQNGAGFGRREERRWSCNGEEVEPRRWFCNGEDGEERGGGFTMEKRERSVRRRFMIGREGGAL